MHLRIYLLLTTCALLGHTQTIETSTRAASSAHDEIYIDDESALEGSGGGRGEIRDDLESSGSGYGPLDNDDDEDNALARSNSAGTPYKGGTVDHDLGLPSVKNEDIEPTLTKENVKGTNSQLPTTHDNNEIELIESGSANTGVGSNPSATDNDNVRQNGNEVFVMDPKQVDPSASFFAQPGILAAVIGGAVVGLLCAILVVMFIVYRMRKKDEGSYALEEPKRSPASNTYAKNSNNREFYA
ncbi:syndecan-like isoform X2 [Ctenocephalides felis]|uniref:syndecan-like isoform X2 n=1 Tax=Ctenocephalides felis TaxID=7515 RepID=UPI000E6E376E|nr:syndecan-like isoform X2 [Ctenocephalides felis]